MSAVTPIADMCGATSNVRYGPKADMVVYSITSSARAKHCRMRKQSWILVWDGLSANDPKRAPGSLASEQMVKATRTIPIVFIITPDPVGSGYVESLSRPGGNATGFMMFDYNLCGKWLELLKEIASSVTA